MKVFQKRWFRSFLIGFLSMGMIAVLIVILLSGYAFRDVDRRFGTPASDTLRTIHLAEEQFRSSYPKRGYSRSLAELSGTTCGTPSESSACLIDQAVANASDAAHAKSGYLYTYVAGAPNARGVIESYSAHGDPASPQTGTKHFYIDQTGVERVEKDKLAGKNSPVKEPE